MSATLDHVFTFSALSLGAILHSFLCCPCSTVTSSRFCRSLEDRDGEEEEEDVEVSAASSPCIFSMDNFF